MRSTTKKNPTAAAAPAQSPETNRSSRRSDLSYSSLIIHATAVTRLSGRCLYSPRVWRLLQLLHLSQTSCSVFANPRCLLNYSETADLLQHSTLVLTINWLALLQGACSKFSVPGCGLETLATIFKVDHATPAGGGFTSIQRMLPLLLPVSHSDTLFSSPTNASTFNIDRQKLPVRKAADRPKSSRHDSLDNSAAINAIPLPPPAPTLLAELTPCHEQYPDLASVQFQQSLDLPVSPSTGAPLIPKSMRELRLPSFDALGITASVPEVSSTDPSVHQPNVDLTVKNADLPHIRNASLSCPSALPPSPLSDAALEHQHPQPVPAGYRPVNSFVLTHTPPDDTGVIDWGLPNAKSSAEPSHEQSTRSETSSISPSGVTSVSARGASLGMADQPSALYNSGKAPWLNHALESIRKQRVTGHCRDAND